MWEAASPHKQDVPSLLLELRLPPYKISNCSHQPENSEEVADPSNNHSCVGNVRRSAMDRAGCHCYKGSKGVRCVQQQRGLPRPGVKQTSLTGLWCPVRVCMSCPEGTSNSATVPSMTPHARRFPSGLNATLSTNFSRLCFSSACNRSRIY